LFPSSTVPKFNALLFQNFDDDICAAFTSSVSGYKCTKETSGQTTVVALTKTPSVEISYDTLLDLYTWEQWVHMAPSTRVQG